MKKYSGSVCLYNLIFPVYLIMLLSPALWIFMIAGNFLIDSAVVLAVLALSSCPKKTAVWRKCILKVVLFGFLSDLLGSLLYALFQWGMMLLNLDLLSTLNPYIWPSCALHALPAVGIAALFLYYFNSRFSFRKAGLSQPLIHRLALALTVLTAPYVMLVPLETLQTLMAPLGA